MVGRAIFQYRVLEKLGEGGMGAVYKARDARLGRMVAIKVLPADRLADPDLKARLIREAQVASGLNHSNIVAIYEIETTEIDGQSIDFIAMEFVDGQTIEELVGGKGLPIDRILKYGIQIAGALTAAHDAGIIHRDLKPSNIMVTRSGVIKVLDFGLAKAVEPVPDTDETAAAALRTEKGTLLGTAAYMSPEQIEGKEADERSDIFALGSTLYQMVTGRHAFKRQNVTATAVAILRDDPQPPSTLVRDLPLQLEQLMNRCLRKDPARRIQHMDDIKLELEDLRAELGIISSRIRGAKSPANLSKRWLAVGLAGLGTVALGVALYAFTRNRPSVPGMNLIPVATYPGLERTPTLSPDGKQAAFSWNGPQQDNFDIYVKFVKGGDLLRLTTTSGHERSPAWSPDSRHIAFTRDGSVFEISPLGGSERKIVDAGDIFFGVQLAWTPDSNFIIVPKQTSPGSPFSLWTVGTSGHPGHRVTWPPDGLVGDSDPAVSPDGHWLAFRRALTSSSDDLFLQRLEGGDVRRLTRDNGQIQGLTWAPDGQSIIFSSNRGGSSSLWRVSIAKDQELTRVPGTGPGVVFPASSKGPPPEIICSHLVVDYNIGQVELSGTHPSASSGREIIASTRADDSPRLSPDGSRITFVSDRTGTPEIWIANRDGTNPLPLTFLGSSSGSPHWSPDGKIIVFDSLIEGNKDIYSISVEGGSPRRLTTDTWQEWRPSYSRDGRWIYFGSDRSRSQQIWKMPSEGGAAVQVTKNRGYEALEGFDGRNLFYTKSKPRPGLWTVPVTGGEESPIVAQARTGFWDVADQGVYFFDFAKASGLGMPLYLYQFQTHRAVELIRADRAVYSGSCGLSVSRNGRSALYLRADHADSELLLLENFR